MSRERRLSAGAVTFDMTTLKVNDTTCHNHHDMTTIAHCSEMFSNSKFVIQESLALAEMKAAAASREIVKNLDIKHQLR